MNRNTSVIMGLIFILTSGLIFTIERLSSYIYWFAQKTNSSSYPTVPEPLYFGNIFTWLFLLIGIVLLFITFKKEIYNYLNLGNVEPEEKERPVD
ncbi:hypothetical protein AB1K89_07300 [Sporosarcina sp. 179-K 8C2 HS]|uniref:hypothetical protein n=1 Tax=Sporosarcina sp. 179-K 8C2 HS TaxID=3142387 RepID=UPI0039A2BBBE